jgi:hypothetical protein
LYEAIEKLLDDPDMAVAMGAAGRVLAVEKFTIDAMMTSVTARYRSLLGPIGVD